MAAAYLQRLRTLFMVRNSNVWRRKLHTSQINFAYDATSKTNLYEILKLSSSASPNEIKQAYYDLTLKYHPDRNENSEEAAKKFREVTEAYEILGNYGLRKKYDKGIPLTIVKKAKKAPVEHHVKYQKFFDSRTAQSSSKHAEEIAELSSKPAARKSKDDAEHWYKDFEDDFEETRQNKNAVQFVVVTYLGCIMIYSNLFQ